MSDLMLLGVLRMPFNTNGDLHLMQLAGRCHDAADRIESDTRRIAELETRVNELDDGGQKAQRIATLEAENQRLIEMISAWYEG